MRLYLNPLHFLLDRLALLLLAVALLFRCHGKLFHLEQFVAAASFPCSLAHAFQVSLEMFLNAFGSEWLFGCFLCMFDDILQKFKGRLVGEVVHVLA